MIGKKYVRFRFSLPTTFKLRTMKLPKINYTLLSVLAVDLLASTGDATMTWSSPMYEKLYSNDTSVNPIGRPITSEEDTWIGSLINIGAMVGPFIYGYLAGKFGRKKVLLSIALPHFIAYLTMAFANSVYLFYFGRILGGLAVGGGYTLLPMYLAEVAEASNRGKYSVTLLCFWTIGNFIPYAIGPFLSSMTFNLVLACLPIIFFLVFSITAPESPFYLVIKDRYEEAEKALMYLRGCGSEGVEAELEEIKRTVNNQETGQFMDIFRTAILRKALFIALMLIMFQQMSGVNAVLFYLQTIFDQSGTTISPVQSQIYFGLVLMGSSLLPPFLTDKYGRRILIVISCFGQTIAISALGAFFYLKNSTSVDVEPIFWLPILSLILYIIFFNFGLSVVPWTLSSELFPTPCKGTAAALTSCTCWTLSFLITKFFNQMVASMGIGPSFWLFAGFCAVGCVFSLIMIPETKGKTFEEIQIMLSS